MTTIRPVPVLRFFAAAALIAGLGVRAATHIQAQGGGSITISSCPGSPCVLKAGPDFATDAFGDPWDFSNREDIALDPAQLVAINNLSVANGVVSGSASDTSSSLAVLETPWGGIINPGKTGQKYPIDQTRFTKLAVKMNAGDGARHPRVSWFHNVIGVYDGGWLYFDKDATTPAGNGIYVIDMTQVNQNGVPQGTPWANGSVVGLSFQPNDQGSSFTFSFDWVRLTTGDTHPDATKMTITWSGTTSGNITVTDAASTVYTIKTGVTGSGTFTWNYGVLPPGTYTLKVGNTSKTFRINAPPLIRVTDPDQTGGADFATDVMGNPWDMNDSADVFENVNIVNHILVGDNFLNGEYNATSDGQAVAMSGSIPVGDPQMYLLSNQQTSNTHDIIDTTKYHRLTYGLRIDRAFDLARGSVARVFWGSASSDSLPGGTPYNVTTTKDIIVWPGMNQYTIDLAQLTTAPNGGLEAANATPWTQTPVRHFRIDPHEFAEQITFHVDNVKLAADDQTQNGSFTIRWTGSDADAGDSPTVALYYLPPGGSFTLITAGIPLGAGAYTWNTSGVPPGTYSIFAVASDALNWTGHFATGPLKVVTFTPASKPFIALYTPTANQVVTSSFEVFGWALDQAAPSGTGVDAIQFYVFPNGGLDPGVFIGQGRVGISRPDVAAIFGTQFTNSGFHFTITGMGPGNFVLGAYAHSTVTNSYSIVRTVPITVSATALMGVDVPTAEATISGDVFSVAGWAIDRNVENTPQSGTGVDTVHVWAYPNPYTSNDPPIFLGVATMGLDRPDVAALYGSRYRFSGWVLAVQRSVIGLPPGVYNIVPNAHSTATNSFNNLAVVQVIMQ